MRSVRIYKPILLVYCCMVLVSCSLIDFSEDCVYFGDAEIKPDWSELAKGDIQPPFTDIYLLSPQKNYNYRISADTVLKAVQAVSYKVLAFNSYGLENITLSGMDYPDVAKVELVTNENSERLYTVQAPAFYAANTILQVIPFGRVSCEPVLQSAVRQVNIDFVVVDDTNIGVSAINAELSGIAYIYGFRELDALESSAWLSFGSAPQEEKTNVFSSALKVLGVNPKKQSIGRIENLLDISLHTTDGNSFRQTIDLTDVFNGFTTRIINITIEIRLGSLGIEVDVTGWNVSDGGIIEL